MNWRLGSFLLCLGYAGSVWASGLVAVIDSSQIDPCAAIANKTWVSPQDARACFSSFPVVPDIKANIVDVLNKSLAFHTSVNYQRQAPIPFEDIHEDVHADLARVSSQDHSSDFDLHVDLVQALKRLVDGHCFYMNLCYDSLYTTYLPIPLVLLTDELDVQHVHIAPEAFKVSSGEFGEELDFWQDALPEDLRGKLELLSGAEVLSIDGDAPFVAVNGSAVQTGRMQAFGTRQNMFFASYGRTESGWVYYFGDFAAQSLPLRDLVTLTLQMQNGSDVAFANLPYRSRLSSAVEPWTNASTFWANNCLATNSTNGVNLYAQPNIIVESGERQQQPFTNPALARSTRRKHHKNELVDASLALNIELPSEMAPSSPLKGSSGVSQFYMLNATVTDTPTGVLMLGSFSASSFDDLQSSLLIGLQNLKEKGAEQLIVDVAQTWTGYICIAHWLHRIIAGPKDTTIPQAGLQTQTRASPLAQLIVKNIASGADPENLLLYNPLNWEYANNTPFPGTENWLQPPVKKTVNGVEDTFSQRLGDECQPFEMDPPAEPLFDAKKVVIISNGRCASSCSLFSITMAKGEGATTVVVGGKDDIPQQYCGVVGGQSIRFPNIDTEIKTAGLKNHTLAPPDFITNSLHGITWRLGFGIDDPRSRRVKWQDHPADVNFPLTADIVNKPTAIWEEIAKTLL
ncbi:uncharacterized protein B0H18DRAFT_870866 [Fomitopsis serialis]|uniref:uncharacterized protein n=1 Tax=Fomitopsis serialis TaxID=139415 RepID=UPI0020082CFC|nr:uncharacterized protein B0H18DRAFT_870866 [Neoantrodia serialis]KAH9932970.1 hypothetical protein B0H18DRAFT_870866 [Neoantrodia serialis]